MAATASIGAASAGSACFVSYSARPRSLNRSICSRPTVALSRVVPVDSCRTRLRSASIGASAAFFSASSRLTSPAARALSSARFVTSTPAPAWPRHPPAPGRRRSRSPGPPSPSRRAPPAPLSARRPPRPASRGPAEAGASNRATSACLRASRSARSFSSLAAVALSSPARASSFWSCSRCGPNAVRSMPACHAVRPRAASASRRLRSQAGQLAAQAEAVALAADLAEPVDEKP